MSKKEWAWKLFKNVVKAGVTMFVIGALLGVITPPIATFMGPALIGQAAFEHAIATPILQTGVFFGMFGAASAIITPAVNYIFGERATKTVTAKTLGVRSRSLGYEQAPDISAAQGHAIAHDPSAAISVASAMPSTHFQDMVSASRAAMKPPGIA